MGVPNKPAEFMQLVADMRAAQKEYFKFRYSGTLQRAKHLEHRVDEILARQLGDRMPLFDTMEPADDEKHGTGSAEWRKDPLSVLKLSLPSISILNEADILFVGQLQDRVQDKPEDWWESITGMTAPVAAAIVDRLNEFLFKNEKRKK